MRKCDRSLGTAGKSPYDSPKEGTPYRGFVDGSIALFYSIYLSPNFNVYGTNKTKDCHHTVIEVYPGAAWRVLNHGVWPAKKHTKIGREERFNIMKKLGLTFPQFGSVVLPTHDQLDAAIAAYTGYLFINHGTVNYGDSPIVDSKKGILREGFIVQPKKIYV